MSLYPIVKNGEYGFIRDDGAVVIAPQYESAMAFSEGLAGIQRNGKWGFVNASGEVVIPPRFDSCQPFAHGLAVVKCGKSTQYVDTSGRVAISTEYYRCNSFEGDLAPVMPDVRSKGAFIDRNGAVVLSGRNYLISHFSHGLIK